MEDRFGSASREEEGERLVALYGSERFEALNEAIEGQFRTLHNRAQVLLALSGVLLTSSVMLMTGKLIARPDLPHLAVASRLMIAAGIADLSSAAFAVAGVLRIRWVGPASGELTPWVMARLAYRDRKTRVLHTSIGLLLIAMVLYQAAASLVLAQL